jgi:hypothetical protein
MATLADIRARFPEFAAVSDDRVNLFLGDTALLMASVDSGKWLDFYDLAQSYYTAHLIYVGEAQAAGDGTVQAPTKKQEVDDVIIEHAVSGVTATMDDLHSSSYGKRYMQYRKLCLVGPRGV